MTSLLSPIAVAVVVHEGNVLVGTRAANAAEAAGFDEFPGGKVEPHESAAEAAARECLEETGVAVRMLDRACTVIAQQPPLRTISFHWAAPLDAGVPPRQPFAWLPIAELPRRRFPGANAAVLTMLRTEHAAQDHGGS
jgi:8-oxo-dGTP diphosphatase